PDTGEARHPSILADGGAPASAGYRSDDGGVPTGADRALRTADAGCRCGSSNFAIRQHTRQVRGGGVRAPEAGLRYSEGGGRTGLPLLLRERRQAIPKPNLGGEAPGRIEIGGSAKLSIHGGSS